MLMQHYMQIVYIQKVQKDGKASCQLAGVAGQCDNGGQFITLILRFGSLAVTLSFAVTFFYAVYRSVNGSIYLHDEQRVKTCSA